MVNPRSNNEVHTMTDTAGVTDFDTPTWHGCKIQTVFVNPPVPFRNLDWCATLDGYEEDGRDCYGMAGHGCTRTEAIADLLEQLND